MEAKTIRYVISAEVWCSSWLQWLFAFTNVRNLYFDKYKTSYSHWIKIFKKIVFPCKDCCSHNDERSAAILKRNTSCVSMESAQIDKGFFKWCRIKNTWWLIREGAFREWPSELLDFVSGCCRAHHSVYLGKCKIIALRSDARTQDTKIQVSEKIDIPRAIMIVCEHWYNINSHWNLWRVSDIFDCQQHLFVFFPLLSR